jgi:hypothetical protein
MNTLNRARATTIGTVILAIVTQTAVASAIVCERAWPASFTCRSIDGAFEANASGANLGGTHRQLAVSFQVGRKYAQAGARDAAGSVIGACTTPQDQIPRDGKIAIADCDTTAPPAGFVLVVL